MRTHFSITLAVGLLGTLGILSPALAAKPSSAQLPPTAKETRYLRSGDWLGLVVWSPKNEKLGKVKDVIINPETGKIDFLGMSPSTSGMSGHYVAIPSSAVEVRYDSDSRQDYLLVNLQPSQIAAAPQFKSNNWQAFDTSDFVNRVNQFYKPMERTAARPAH